MYTPTADCRAFGKSPQLHVAIHNQVFLLNYCHWLLVIIDKQSQQAWELLNWITTPTCLQHVDIIHVDFKNEQRLYLLSV